MSKCWAKSTPLSLSEQMRQTLIDTLKTHFPLDLHARTLDETQVWELVLYASVQGLSLDSACQTLADVPSGNRVRKHLKEARWHRIDLPQDFQGKMLYLRVYSDYSDHLGMTSGSEIVVANQLNQVFMNLLVNAAQAIEDKGTVTIRTWVDNGQVDVQIVDTGKGISSEHLEHIFDPGWTTKSRGVGTGLGLSISYNIVENHGGKLLVESMPGAGATFTVHLPIEA